MSPRVRDNWQWGATLAILAITVLPFYWAWKHVRDPFWQGIVEVAAYFYPLAFLLILPLVKRYWPDAKQGRRADAQGAMEGRK
jgi:hypothetical protein